MKKQRIFPLFFLALIFVAKTSAGENIPSNFKKVQFRAQFSELSIMNGATNPQALLNGVAKGKASNDYLDVSYPGLLYNPSLILNPVEKGAAQYDTPIHAAQAEFSAMKAEDDTWIIDSFAQEDQTQIQQALNDPQLRDQDLKYFRSIGTREITGEIRYKDYAILFINGLSSGPLPYTYRQTDRGWRRTNALASDEILDILLPIVHLGKGEMKEINP